MCDWTEKMAALPPDERRAMVFLQTHLPLSDLDGYPFELFLRFARHALGLRRRIPWCAALDWEIFCHYVLCPRVNNEDLSFYSETFCGALLPGIAGLAIEEAVLAVNRWCHEQASYELSDARTVSPLTVLRAGGGRCGEESVFLVAALRSVGIPARQVYVPLWSHCDDNHAWVEVLCRGQWHFLGACEPEPVLNLGWFNAAAAQAMLVRSRTFGEGTSPLHGEPIGREGQVYWYNQIARYAPVRSYTLRALRGGEPVPGAIFQIQVLNEAAFQTVVTLTAGENGEARITMGIGDFRVMAVKDGLYAEADSRDREVMLHLALAESGDSPWRELDFHPPEPAPLSGPGLNARQKKDRAAVLREGSALRNARIEGFFDPAWAGSQSEKLLRLARGNAGEIAAFLERDGDFRREKLLGTLTDKDLRDISIPVLKAHLTRLPERGTLPEEIYWPYVACPRISTEPLTDWREALHTAFRETDPVRLWTELRSRVRIETERYYAGLVWTPAEALRAGRCDEKSLKVLFVAALRAQGIPARLRPMDGEAEFWQDGAFQSLKPESVGRLRIQCEGEPAYGQSWSLARREAGAWRPLSLSAPKWRDGRWTAELPCGQYRLVTTVRLPAGDQLAAQRELTVRAGECREAELYLRPYKIEEHLYCRQLPPVPAETPEGEQLPDVCRIFRRTALLLWLEPGREPTEHLVNELTGLERPLEADLAVLLRQRENLPTLREKWPNIRVFLGDWDDVEPVARRLNCDPGQMPLAVILDREGRARFGLSGYRVGAAELLARIIEQMS